MIWRQKLVSELSFQTPHLSKVPLNCSRALFTAYSCPSSRLRTLNTCSSMYTECHTVHKQCMWYMYIYTSPKEPSPSFSITSKHCMQKKWSHQLFTEGSGVRGLRRDKPAQNRSCESWGGSEDSILLQQVQIWYTEYRSS